jgi:hypothetical protein
MHMPWPWPHPVLFAWHKPVPPPTQHPPALQARPAQQAWLSPPQATQVPGPPARPPTHIEPAPHMRLAQQGLPAVPQALQRSSPVSQDSPVPVQTLPAQQAWLATVPQAEQVPFMHMPPLPTAPP